MLRFFLEKRFHFRILLILLAVELIILGMLLGENRATRQKASYLCLECIGIG